ncbi:protein phosphatase 2C domain-containing protein [Catellatospora sp. NPDC049111]|uniref:protein phosphatase 2C domain-containing protein n=1 Tax=Catellatospora sp. NPDC049111 TaxID=3155271 RepID=UPI0033E25401
MSEISVIAIGEPGRAATELGPRLPTHYPESADHEITEAEVPGAQIRAASVRGLMHRRNRKPRQDRFSVTYDDDTQTLLIVVCDGVGQFELSQEAAAFVAADAPRAYLEHGTWRPAVDEVNKRLTDYAAGAGERVRFGRAPEDLRMATTFAAAAVRRDGTRWTASVAWTDDSTVWLLDEGHWTPVAGAEAVEDGSGLHTTKVRALPHAEPQLTVVDTELTGGALFLFTDGIGEPLRHARQVQDTLADWWATPPDVFTFAGQVGFARKGNLDDRTAVGVWFE